MNPTKYPHPDNYLYLGELAADAEPTRTNPGIHFQLTAYAGDLFRIAATCSAWTVNHSTVELDLPDPMASASLAIHGASPAGGAPAAREPVVLDSDNLVLELSAQDLVLKTREGRRILEGKPGQFFGQNGESSIFRFRCREGAPFYGCGERTGSLNLRGRLMNQWNLDVLADHPGTAEPAAFDAGYVSVPFLVTRGGEGWLGLLLHNPSATFMETAFFEPEVYSLGAANGMPELFIFWAETLAGLLEAYSRVVGRSPLPPRWSLGYHQCRWGYQSEGDVKRISQACDTHGIPCSAVWLDIDYMQDFRIFTIDEKKLSDPVSLSQWLERQGRRLVMILDPGLAAEDDYWAYREAGERGLLCQTASGKAFTGQVWPGNTVFPDFSLQETGEWWSEKVAAFLKRSGCSGLWIDMNDPSTGWVDRTGMLFRRGELPHWTFHNQYGHLMAKYTYEGFRKQYPQRRPFILTRSACAGTQRYAAVWTGDNYSNFTHLKNSISMCLNLGLSGLPFIGPDVGGFTGNTDEELCLRWFQAAFLFPFFRNHSAKDTTNQEPWAFSPPALDTIRGLIELRMRLLPYLYALFHLHRRSGAPLLRPLLWEWDEERWKNVDDAFLVGPFILQAPVLERGGAPGRAGSGAGEPAAENSAVKGAGASPAGKAVGEKPKAVRREVSLPPGRWFDLTAGHWVGGRLDKEVPLAETLLFIREGALLWDSENHVHLFCPEHSSGGFSYFFDDGESLEYLSGGVREARLSYRREGAKLLLTLNAGEEWEAEAVEGKAEGIPPITPVVYDTAVREVLLNGKPTPFKRFTEAPLLPPGKR